MTVSDLRAETRKQLATRAKRHQIAGWHEMTKEDLIRALVRRLRSTKGMRPTRAKTSPARSSRTAARPASSPNGSGSNGHTNGASKPKSDKTRAHVIASTVRRQLKPTAIVEGDDQAPKDRISARAHDAFWIYVEWTLTQNIIDRAVAALGVEWHQAVPVLRLFDVTTNDAETPSKIYLRDIEIHGEIDHWYVPVENPPRAYRLHIGYRGANGTFFTMAKSNRVTLPRPGAPSPRANGTAQPGSTDMDGNDASVPKKRQNLRVTHVNRARESSHTAYNGEGFLAGFPFKLETELIVHGSTHPDAELTLLGDPVPVRKDGTFSLRFTLPNGRQVIPAVAIHPHGAEQRTIVLGIERNTKELEPLPLDEMAQ
ncbi:MAG: DUF4912 domain-containing protein [Planctomycetaceae bacterium]